MMLLPLAAGMVLTRDEGDLERAFAQQAPYLFHGADGARVHSWVRASHAQLDAPLWRAVSEWLARDWPFGSVEYAPRD
jgi:hypothetical protein